MSQLFLTKKQLAPRLLRREAQNALMTVLASQEMHPEIGNNRG